VWKLDEERGLVITTDFFTPIVDDPYDYGQISAANSISDIYAMGGTPFLALNIAAIPPNLPYEMATEILRGGADKAKEAGVVIAGGHTIQDKEPKYGLIVLGIVLLKNVLIKGGMQAGDTLFLSKPIGSGVIGTGIKKDIASADEAKEAIGWMKRLNKDAAQIANKCSATAATDITGFSLLGHGWEMASASKVGLKIRFDHVPLYSGTARLAKEWCFAGGAFDNKEFYGPHIHFDEVISEERQMILFDPQTSGGLLLSIPAGNAADCLLTAKQMGVPLWKIGEVTDSGKIEVT
jgi:selenide,water dikinase